jgi:hypothetical protein
MQAMHSFDTLTIFQKKTYEKVIEAMLQQGIVAI